jgi:nucleoside-diphosphate-sugar epimerase
MSAEVEADMALGVRVNLLGMVNMFEAAARHKLARLVFTSSETVFGASQEVYGERPVVEDDFCGPNDHFFTYGVMKILDEFMAQKYHKAWRQHRLHATGCRVRPRPQARLGPLGGGFRD